MRKIRSSSTEKLLFTVAQRHYEEGQNNTEIGRALGVSSMHVTRLLREAGRRGIVQISVRAPRHEALEHGLATTFGLRDVRVVSDMGDESRLRVSLGVEAARLFQDVAIDGTRIGVGSGRTMYEMVNALPEGAVAVELFPLAAIADQSLEIRSLDATTLVTTLWFKFRPAASGLKFNLVFPAIPADVLRGMFKTYFDENFLSELHQYFLSASALFFSASHLRKDSQLLDIARPQGFSLEQLRERGVIGDYLFRTVGRDGNGLPVGIDDYVLGVELSTLRELAGNHQKVIALVAGGHDKWHMIEAGLRAHYFNTLITDDETARFLLKSSNAIHAVQCA
jgi:DNA-binding transcriptional regulator LsrR (DeoR family)